MPLAVASASFIEFSLISSKNRVKCVGNELRLHLMRVKSASRVDSGGLFASQPCGAHADGYPSGSEDRQDVPHQDVPLIVDGTSQAARNEGKRERRRAD